MALRNMLGVPHKGWTLVDVVDLYDQGYQYGDYQDCEFCDQDQIRYVHILQHPEYSETIEVGCVCAEHLTEDYVNPRRRERELRNRAARRSRFPKRKWKLSSRGNPYIEYGGYHAVIFETGDKYRVKIGSQWGKKVYDSLHAAKLAVFDGIEWAKANGKVL